MVKQFWRTMTGLAVLVCAFTLLSWAYIQLAHVQIITPNRYSTWTNFPTQFPSIWNIIRPQSSTSGSITLLVLLLQIFLTGGLYGTLIRANTGHFASINSFFSDSFRTFLRLLVWNVLWTAIFLLIADISRVSQGLALFITVLALIVRFIFIFAETALVAEGHVQMATALRRAATTLISVFVPMIPFALIILLISGFAALAVVAAPAISLLTGIIYVLAMTWLLHMIVARYLAYSNYHAKAK